MQMNTIFKLLYESLFFNFLFENDWKTHQSPVYLKPFAILL